MDRGGRYTIRPMETFDPFLHLNEVYSALDWAEVFGNENPVEIEIGIGKGTLLRRMAAEAPDRNFVGVERALKYVRIGGQRITRDLQMNIRLVRTDAIHFLQKFVPAASVSVFHIYFSDPWPKKRHAKRRLFQPETVRLLEDRTIPGGAIRIRTDVDWYHVDICELFERESGLEVVEKGRVAPEAISPEMMTNFETKFRAVGKEVYSLSLRKPKAGESPSR